MDELGIPGTMCRTIDEWLNSEHSMISGATVTIDDPTFGKMKQAGKIVRLYNHDQGNLDSARASQIEKPPTEVNW